MNISEVIHRVREMRVIDIESSMTQLEIATIDDFVGVSKLYIDSMIRVEEHKCQYFLVADGSRSREDSGIRILSIY